MMLYPLNHCYHLSGCLASIASFIIHCGKDLMTEDVTRRIMAPVESAISMVAHLPYVLKVRANEDRERGENFDLRSSVYPKSEC